MNNKPYIIYFGRFELPDKNALAHRIKANANIFRELGYDVILVGYSRSLPLKNGFLDEEGNICYEVKYPTKTFEWVLEGFYYKQIIKILQGRKNCKAIIFTGVGIGNTTGLLSIRNKFGIPIVSDTVDWFTYNGNDIYNLFKRWEEKFLVYNLKPKAHNIICISTFLEKHYKKANCYTVVIPSLTFSSDSRFKNLPCYSPNEEVSFCYVGDPGYKGKKDRIDWCVKAFCELNKTCMAKMNIYGIDKDTFIDQFSDAVEMIEFNRAVQEGRLNFFGRRDNRECIKAISISDFFVFAREDNQITKAGFPTKFSESMAIGTPVVTTPTSDLAKYIRNGENGYVCIKCTYDSLKDTMLTAIHTTKEKRMYMHKACKENPLDISFFTDSFQRFLSNLRV